MNFNIILKVIVLIFWSSCAVYAQEFYSYKLFDNKFQAVFPGEPSIQQYPKELLDPKSIEKSLPYEYTKQLSQKQIKKIVSDTIIKLKNRQSYIFTDKINRISFTAQSMPSELEHKNYIWSDIKKLLDDMTYNELKGNNQELIEFSSTLDKKKNTYIAIYTSIYFMEGQKVYSSTKKIYYKDKLYRWHIGYTNKKDKKIFDSYRQHCKVIK